MQSFLYIKSDFVDKPSRINRLYANVFKKGELDIHKMEDIPLQIREKIASSFEVLSLKVAKIVHSKDGTVKFLFSLKDGLFIESVLLFDNKNRPTMCISTQVGCRMGCRFCKTASMGLMRNLNVEEIISQVIYLFAFMRNEKAIFTDKFNIVYMGMGEPFDNYDALVRSIEILTEKNYFALHPSWITVSTCGIMDRVLPILEMFPRLRVAVSLNSAVNEYRSQIMPINNRFSVEIIHEVLMEAFRLYGRRFLLEYVLIPEENDDISAIEALEIFNHRAFHINVIPYNAGSETQLCLLPSMKFIDALKKKGLFVTRRVRRGDDIAADCGQLFVAALEKTW